MEIDYSGLPPGVYRDEPEDIYYKRELGVMSNSVLRMVAKRTPAYYKAWIDGDLEEKSSDVFDLGKAFHTRVLEPHKFSAMYVDLGQFGDMRSSKARARRDEFIANHPNVTPIKKKDIDAVNRMYEAIMRKPKAAAIMSRGWREVVLRWIDRHTGLPCKARVDYYDPEIGFSLDLKSVLDASHDYFSRSVVNYGYDTQACFYDEGCKELGLENRGFIFLLAEKERPHLSALRILHESAEEAGFNRLTARKDLFASMIKSGTFSGYSDDIEIQHIPGWAFSNLEV